MFWLIFGIIAIVVTFIGCGFKKEKDDYGRYQTVWKLNIKQTLAIFGLLLVLPAFITKIPVNTVGIIYDPFNGVEEETLSEGFHTKGLFDKIYKINTEVQTTIVENLTTQTKDAQYLTSVLDIKYRVSETNAHMVFKQFRTLKTVSESLIVPTTQRVLEGVTTEYNVIDILGEKRSEVYTELERRLSEEFAKYGIEFYSISITDMDAGAALEAAITEEAVAKKAVETAEQKLAKAETEAKQKAVQAQAEQDAAIIEAETKVIQAEAEKKANDLLNQSLTEEILKKEWIDKWDGKMPTYYGGNANLMIGMDEKN